MKLVKYIIAVAMAVSMTLSLAACSDTSWVYDYSGKKIPSGLYLAFSVGAYSSAEMQVDAEKDMFKQKIEDKDVEQWITDSVKKQCDQYIAVENKFDELGLKLSDDDNQYIAQSTEEGWAQIGVYYSQNSVSISTYKLIVTNQRKQNMIFEKYYGKGGLEEVSNDTLLTYYKANYTTVNMFGLQLATGDELTDEQKASNAELKTLADQYAALFNEKKNTLNEIYDMYRHYKAKDSHDATKSDDTIAKDEDTLSPIKKDSTSPSEKVVKAIFNDVKPDGTAKVISDESGYYVVVRYDDKTTESKFEDIKSSVLGSIKGADFTKLVEEWAKAQKSSENNASVKRYNPKKINLVLPTE